MKWPEFERRFPGAKASVSWSMNWDTMQRVGPLRYTVEWNGASVTRGDHPGVLAEIAEAMNG